MIGKCECFFFKAQVHALGISSIPFTTLTNSGGAKETFKMMRPNVVKMAGDHATSLIFRSGVGVEVESNSDKFSMT